MPAYIDPGWEYWCPPPDLEDMLSDCADDLTGFARFDLPHETNAQKRQGNIGFRFGKGDPDKFLPTNFGKAKRPHGGSERKQPESVNCVHCKRAFKPERPSHTFCSRACRCTQYPPPQTKVKLDHAAILAAYDAGEATTVIAERHGTNHRWICTLVKKNGRPPRPAHRPKGTAAK